MENKPKEIKDLEKKGYVELSKDQIEKHITSDRYEYELFDVDSDEAQSILLFDNTMSNNGLTVENADAISTDFLFNKYSKEDVEKVIQRFSEDLTIYGGGALKIYRSNDRTKIAKVEYIPVYNLRWTTNRKKLVYSDDWFIRK